MVSRTTARSGAAIPNPRYPAFATAATRSSTVRGLTSPLRPGTTSPAEVQQVANRSGKCAILNSFVGWTRSALGAARRSRQIQSDDRQTDSRLADIGSVLLDETLKNTVCSMTPLLWSVLVDRKRGGEGK